MSEIVIPGDEIEAEAILKRARKYTPSKYLPAIVMVLETTSPSKIVDWILRRFNEKRTPESISRWFNTYHPDVKEKLKRWLDEKGVVEEEEVVKPSTFVKGTFEKLPSVDKWIKVCRRKDTVKEETLSGYLGALKRFCMGIFPLMDKNTQLYKVLFKAKGYREEDFEPIDLKEHGWSLKHPDRLTESDYNEWIDLMNEYYPKVDTSAQRLACRNFYKRSLGIDVEFIAGAKHSSAGDYARLYVPKDILFDILDYVKDINYEAYVADGFMWHTGTRVTATLKANLKDIMLIEDWIPKDDYTGRKENIIEEKEREGKMWVKVENNFITV